jgi:hypothetical protein
MTYEVLFMVMSEDADMGSDASDSRYVSSSDCFAAKNRTFPKMLSCTLFELFFITRIVSLWRGEHGCKSLSG